MTFEELQDSVQDFQQVCSKFWRVQNHTIQEHRDMMSIEIEFSRTFLTNCRDWMVAEFKRSFTDIESAYIETIVHKVFHYCYDRHHSNGYLTVLYALSEELTFVIDILKLFIYNS